MAEAGDQDRTVTAAAANDSGGAAGPPEGAPELPGYRIERVLGHGGMGTVFLARDLRLDREVAIKVLPERLAAEPESRQRFEREARALARIMHPNIVPIHAYGEHLGAAYIVMAYVSGRPLDVVLDDARKPVEGKNPCHVAGYLSRRECDGSVADLASAVLGMNVAHALHALHEQGIVHRDVKPANIVLDRLGHPLLVDFGIACDPTSDRLACDAITSGTLRFLPPEHLSGAIEVGPASDIYSLGVTLYEVLTLETAYPQQEMGDLIAAIRHGKALRPRDLIPSISPRLDEVVGRATAPLPGDRHADARELARDLADVVRGLTCSSGIWAGTSLVPGLESMLNDAPRKGLLSRLGGWFR